MNLKYGKTPARPGTMKLKLSNYVDKSKLPAVPADFGHDHDMPLDWHMLGNDQFGCCVWAGAAHETMLWNHMATTPVKFFDYDVLSDYAAVTGFKPADPSTDNGTDMLLAADYRRKTGIVDSQGKRHKVAAYLALKPGSVSDIWAATYLFGAVGIGLEMPDSTQDQFTAGKPWTIVPGSNVEGGHYVPLVGRRQNFLHVVTWGRVQRVAIDFFQKYCDEAVAYVSLEALHNNKSPEGFDSAALLKDLNALQ